MLSLCANASAVSKISFCNWFTWVKTETSSSNCQCVSYIFRSSTVTPSLIPFFFSHEWLTFTIHFSYGYFWWILSKSGLYCWEEPTDNNISCFCHSGFLLIYFSGNSAVTLPSSSVITWQPTDLSFREEIKATFQTKYYIFFYLFFVFQRMTMEILFRNFLKRHWD